MKKIAKILSLLLILPTLSLAAGKAYPPSTNQTLMPIAGVTADGTMKGLLVDNDGVVQAAGVGGGSGTVTDVSIVSANGLSGSVANSTTTPAITLSTTINGILQGNASAISAAATTGTGNVVLETSPTIVTPTIASFTNATHNHTNSAGGGALLSGAITDFDTQVRLSKLNQMAQPNADVSMNSFKITSLATPTASTDAATKAYADAIASGLLIKTSCSYASTANVPGTYVGSPTFTLTEIGFGALSIDGASPTVGQRILLKNQTTAQENGIYTVTAAGSGGSSYVLTRATDFDASAETITGSYSFIAAGISNAATGYILTTPATITLDTTALAFTQFSGATNYTAGNGMTLSALNFAVGAGTGLVANADDMAVDTSVVATTSNSLTMSNKTLTAPILGGGTQGSVTFLGAAGVISQNNAKFFWNNTSGFLGLGTASPAANLDIFQSAATTGSPNGFKFQGGGHTTLTASTEARDFDINLNRLVQFSTGNFATQRAIYIQAPQYSAVGASTITTAATLAISNAPAFGANMSITRPYSFMSENGNVSFSMASNVGLVVDFLASNTTGSARTVTFKSALTAASSATDFIFATTGTTRTAGSLLSLVNNATSRFSVGYNGAITVNQLAGTSGSPAVFNLTGGAHTTLAAGVEASDVNWNLARVVQFATGALGQQTVVKITPPTYSFVAASTVTKVAGLSISAPNAGTNATFTNTTAANIGGDVALSAATASLFYSSLNVPSHTITFNGNTNMTGVSTANGISIGQITLTDASAVTVDNSSSLYIANAPTASGSVSLTNKYSIFVDAGNSRFDGRVLQTQGADVASSNDLVLGSDGNTFEVTGSTQINAINTADFTLGSEVTLVFAAGVTVKHNTAGGGGTAVILLSGAGDFAATSGDTLTLKYSEQGGLSAWREVGKAVI